MFKHMSGVLEAISGHLGWGMGRCAPQRGWMRWSHQKPEHEDRSP